MIFQHNHILKRREQLCSNLSLREKLRLKLFFSSTKVEKMNLFVQNHCCFNVVFTFNIIPPFFFTISMCRFSLVIYCVCTMTYVNLNPTSMQFSNHIEIEMSKAFIAYRARMMKKNKNKKVWYHKANATVETHKWMWGEDITRDI